MFQILAIDYGGRFIDTALKLQKGEQVEYTKSNGQQAVAMFDGVGYDNVVFKQVNIDHSHISQKEDNIMLSSNWKFISFNSIMA